MSHWRNILPCHDHGHSHGLDPEMRRIDALEAQLAPLPEKARQIRALVSRFDSLSHYRAEDNLRFLLQAIGTQDYPGAPAVDVLHRAWEVDDERKLHFKRYIAALESWCAGQSDAQRDGADPAETEVYETLGTPDGPKRWLAESLAKTLKAFAYNAEDRLEEGDAPTFVRALYHTALGRPPSEDDLQNRLDELAAGKRRAELSRELFDSAESRQRQLHQVLHRLEEGQD